MAWHLSPVATKLPSFSLGNAEELRGLVSAAGFHRDVCPMGDYRGFRKPVFLISVRGFGTALDAGTLC